MWRCFPTWLLVLAATSTQGQDDVEGVLRVLRLYGLGGDDPLADLVLR